MAWADVYVLRRNIDGDATTVTALPTPHSIDALRTKVLLIRWHGLLCTFSHLIRLVLPLQPPQNPYYPFWPSRACRKLYVSKVTPIDTSATHISESMCTGAKQTNASPSNGPRDETETWANMLLSITARANPMDVDLILGVLRQCRRQGPFPRGSGAASACDPYRKKGSPFPPTSSLLNHHHTYEHSLALPRC